MIDKIINTKGRVLIYNGIELNKNLSIGFYQIKENDIIFIIPNERRDAYKKWLEADAALEKGLLIGSPYENYLVLTKLKDRKYLNMELKPKRMRRIMKKVQNYKGNVEVGCEEESSVYIRPQTMPTEPLPIFWQPTQEK